MVNELLKAAKLVDDVSKTLDMNGHVCKECGLHVKQNKEDFRTHTELQAIIRKLQRIVIALQNRTK